MVKNTQDISPSNIITPYLRSGRKRIQTQLYTNAIYKKVKLGSTKINNLPNEMLITIFEWLPRDHVLNNVRLVCKRWNSLVRPRWQSIGVSIQVCRRTLMRWIFNAQWLKNLTITDLRDLNNLLKEVSYCKNLETIKVYGCRGIKKFVKSSAVEQVVLNCKKLSLLSFEDVRVKPWEFFNNLSMLNNKCCYVGSITVSQLDKLLVRVKKFDRPFPAVFKLEIDNERFVGNVNSGMLDWLSDFFKINQNDIIIVTWDLSKGCLLLELRR